MPRRARLLNFASHRARAARRARLRGAILRGTMALGLGLSPLLLGDPDLGAHLGSGAPDRFAAAGLGASARAGDATLRLASSDEAGMIRLEGPARAVDGDTLRLAGERIRLLEIDAPESAQLCQDEQGRDYACGEAASAAMARMVEGARVVCQARERDVYGRPLARCEVEGRDLGEAMVRQGHAVIYRKIAILYEDAEDQARRDRAGMWAGDFQDPWDWRADQRAARARPSADPDRALDQAKGRPAGQGEARPGPECRIKGNVSSNGRIYHRPGQRDYERTRISASRGERWFCSEAEAVQAGWRPAKR